MVGEDRKSFGGAMADKVQVTVKPKTQRVPRTRTRSSSRSRSRSKSKVKPKVVVVAPKTKPQGILKKNLAEKEKRDAKQIKKLQRKVSGPRASDSFETVVTLGTILGNQDDTLTRSSKFLLNPCLLKAKDIGSVATPLSTRASQYSLWKIIKCEVRFTPLCGKATVVGTIIYGDLEQQSGTATAESVDTIKARTHVELAIGQRHVWKINTSKLTGPRQGWWNMDAGDDPTNSTGPGLSFWTYLRTVLVMNSTTTPTPYNGGLYMVELRVRYLFSNYTPQPNLALMTVDTVTPSSSTAVSLVNGSDGSLQMRVTDGNLLRLLEEDRPPGLNAQTGGAGEKFWAVSTEVVNLVANNIGPWGWLLKGGWWCIRKIFGAAGEDAQNNYAIYASISDAKNDMRIYQNVSGSVTLTNKPVTITQLTQPNVNQSSSGAFATRTIQTPYLPLAQAEVVQTPGPNYNGGSALNTCAVNTMFFACPGTWMATSRWNGSPGHTAGENPQVGIHYWQDGSFRNATIQIGTSSMTWWAIYDVGDGVFFGGYGATRGVVQTIPTIMQTIPENNTSDTPYLQPYFQYFGTSTRLHAELLQRAGFSSQGPVAIMFLMNRQQDGDYPAILVLNKRNGTARILYSQPILQTQHSNVAINQAFWSVVNPLETFSTQKTSVEYALNNIAEEEDAESDIASLFEGVDETDFRFHCSLKTSDYLKEEADFWKKKAEQLMLERAMTTGPQTVRFEKSGQWVEMKDLSTSSRGHAE